MRHLLPGVSTPTLLVWGGEDAITPIDSSEIYQRAIPRSRLVSGGRYLFSVWDSHRHNPIGPLITEILQGFLSHDPPQFYQVPFSYHRIDPIKESLDAAGFTDLRIAVLRVIKIIPDVPTYARAVVLGNPLIDQIRTRGGVDPERVIEALAEALPREFSTNPTRIRLQAIVFEATSR